MIRAIPSNASDNVYCTLLAHSVVHGAMAGYTGFTIGQVNGRHCYIPFYVSHPMKEWDTEFFLLNSTSQHLIRPTHCFEPPTPEDNREAEQGLDNRQDVGKASVVDQPAELPLQQSHRRGKEGAGKSGAAFRWLAFPSEG
jgi:hypothetical protein